MFYLGLTVVADKFGYFVLLDWYLRSYVIRVIIIQQIVTLSKYGHDALDICHP